MTVQSIEQKGRYGSCAVNTVRRLTVLWQYECIDVHTDNGVFSLHELRDLVTGNTKVNVQRQTMRNKRLLDQIRAEGGDQVHATIMCNS